MDIRLCQFGQATRIDRRALDGEKKPCGFRSSLTTALTSGPAVRERRIEPKTEQR
jgi:hypothetical protein